MGKKGIWRGAGPIPAIAAALGVAGAAAGQNSWVIKVEYSDPAGVINSLDDTVMINLWAAWDPAQWAFRGGLLDMTADDPLDGGTWSNPDSLFYFMGKKDGVIEGETIAGIGPEQANFVEAGIYADTSNPIKVWVATWQTSQLSPRSVPIFTDSTEFRLYTELEDTFGTEFIDTLAEGSGEINVVPGPGVGVLIACGVICRASTRRRVLRR